MCARDALVVDRNAVDAAQHVEDGELDVIEHLEALLHVGAQRLLALYGAAGVMTQARNERGMEDDVIGVERQHTIQVLRFERGHPALYVVSRLLHRQHRHLLRAGCGRPDPGRASAQCATAHARNGAQRRCAMSERNVYITNLTRLSSLPEL